MFQFIALAASAISSGISAAGSFSQARRLEREGRYLATDAITRGEFAAENAERDLTRILGTQRSQFAAQGVDMGFGSAATIAAETQSFGQADVDMIRENAQKEAFAIRRGYRNAAVGARAQGFGQVGGALESGANAWGVYSRGRAAKKAADSARGSY